MSTFIDSIGGKAIVDGIASKVKAGYVPLNSSNKIDSKYLPSYVDDVKEFGAVVDDISPNDTGVKITSASQIYYDSLRNAFVASTSGGAYSKTWSSDDALLASESYGTTSVTSGVVPSSDKIYVCIDTNVAYRWSGSTLAAISGSAEAGSVTTDSIVDSAVTSDKIANDAVSTSKLASSAVTADKIASSSITKDKLAFTIDTYDGASVYTFNDIVSSATISTSFPSGATGAFVTNVSFDTANHRFVATANFFSGSTTVGSGTYLIKNGYLSLASTLNPSNFAVGVGEVQNSDPSTQCVYVQYPSIASGTSDTGLYYYTTKNTLVKIDPDTVSTDTVNEWISNAFN